MEELQKCPICAGNKLSQHLICTDYLVSKEQFNLVKCDACGFVFTNPRPDQEEIQPYYESEEYYSHRDEKKGLIERIYAYIRGINIKYKTELAGNYINKGERLLDYGCGVGFFIQAMNEKKVQTLGLEPSSNARAIAEANGLSVKPIEALQGIEDKSLSAISMWHVLEHIHELDNTLNVLLQKLRPDATLIVAVPNCKSWDALYYKDKWAAYDVPRHLYHFSNDTISKLFEKYGMYIADTKPLKFDAYYISLLSSNNGVLKYFSAMINGFRSNMSARKTDLYSSTIYILQFKEKPT